MNRVLAAGATAQAHLVEARTKAEVEEIQARSRAETRRVEAEADAAAKRLQQEAEAHAARLEAETEVQVYAERAKAAAVLEQHPAPLLRVRRAGDARGLAGRERQRPAASRLRPVRAAGPQDEAPGT